jgi:hypothetical protein
LQAGEGGLAAEGAAFAILRRKHETADQRIFVRVVVTVPGERPETIALPPAISPGIILMSVVL